MVKLSASMSDAVYSRFC